jgi:hypothetical protein
MIKILLWALMLLFSFTFSGYLHNLAVDNPNWSSGEIGDIVAYKNFHQRSKNSYYFGPILIASCLVCMVLLFLTWNENVIIRNLIIALFIIIAGNLITTFTTFRPIVAYIENTAQYDPLILKVMVKKWMLYNYIRSISYLIGLIISIIAINIEF